MIGLRHLEMFRALMVSGTVTSAARMLQISQPGASKLLGHLEDRMGVKLFQRVRGRVEPTPEAQSLFREVEKVFHSIAIVEKYAQDLKLTQSGAVTVACTPSFSYTLLARAIARFRANRPHVRVWVESTTARHAVEQAAARQVDFAVVYTAADNPLTQAKPLFTSEIVAVMPSGHPLTKLANVTPKQFARYPLIANVRNDALSAMLDRAFKTHSVAREVVIGVNHTHAACALVREGAGVALVEPWGLSDFFPDLVARPFRPRIKLQPLVVTSAQGQLPRLAQCLLDDLHAVVRDQVLPKPTRRAA